MVLPGVSLFPSVRSDYESMPGRLKAPFFPLHPTAPEGSSLYQGFRPATSITATLSPVP